MNRNFEKDLFRLARACLNEMSVDENYGYGLQQDGKRPFGNSGQRALLDTLEQVDIEFDDDASEEDRDDLLDYARDLWRELPEFIRTRCELTLK